ncbi:LysR family transcriptional regulator [Cochlodiniinecator piscidefendens]|uniref:LysR family transcriptional regulator n=1 Tax=Cochlodiniinecator piscidefendens TaxID=2715756 RepID=UPI00140A04A9|nr:LysR family transcriptional regulator [Cochlodiniinecator piscidefendens]
MAVTLKSMRYFVTSVRHGNISKAAKELRIAASAVSASIDQLESQLQLALITRHRSRGIAPTKAGRVMLRKFETLLEEYDAIMSEGAELKDALKGDIRIGYYAPVAPAFLPEIFRTMQQEQSELTFYLEECDNDHAQDGFLAGAFDVILFVADEALPQIEFDVLTKAPAYCLLPAAHRLAQNGSVRLDDLKDENFVLLNRPVAKEYYSRLFEAIGAQPNIAAYANSTEMVRSLVGAGYGCAILNMRPVTDLCYGGNELRAVPIDDDITSLTLAVGYNKTGPRRAVRKFVEECKSYFSTGSAQKLIVRRDQ